MTAENWHKGDCSSTWYIIIKLTGQITRAVHFYLTGTSMFCLRVTSPLQMDTTIYLWGGLPSN